MCLEDIFSDFDRDVQTVIIITKMDSVGSGNIKRGSTTSVQANKGVNSVEVGYQDQLGECQLSQHYSISQQK